MSTMQHERNCMVAQSGGPTVAINASLAGVISGVTKSGQYDTVYGSINGILGILHDNIMNIVINSVSMREVILFM